MRVISGTARGLKLLAPDGNNTRPTADRIKESLFNIISAELCDIEFLDLFSGSGSIGIEALSRGASSASFVDNNNETIQILTKNIEKAKFKDKSTLYKSDVVSAINTIKNEVRQFDIIFLDAPYNSDLSNLAILEIEKCNLLKDDGFIICEQHTDEQLLEFGKFEPYMVRNYKITKMVFLRYK